MTWNSILRAAALVCLPPLFYAAQSLAKPVGDGWALAVLNNDQTNATAVEAALYRLGRPGNVAAIPAICTFIDFPESRNIFMAIDTLGTIGGKEAIECLIDQLRKFNSRLQGDESQKHLHSLNRSDYLTTTILIAKNLYLLGYSRFIPLIFHGLHEDSKVVRLAATGALGSIDTPESRAALWDVYLHDPMEMPRCGAYGSLRELKDPKFLELIEKDTRANDGVHPCEQE